MDVTQLRQLALVADLHFDRSRQDLAKITMREQAIAAELSNIDAQVNEIFNLAVDNGYRGSGADAMFELWAQQRRAALQMERARLRVARSAAMDAMRRAFGRTEALRQLVTSRPLK